MALQTQESNFYAAPATHSVSPATPPSPGSPQTATLEDASLDTTHAQLQILLLQMIKDCPEGRDFVRGTLLLPSITPTPQASPTRPLQDMSVNSLLNGTGANHLESASNSAPGDARGGGLNGPSISTSTHAPKGMKRKAYNMLKVCTEEYSVVEKGPESCHYHPGK